MSSAIIRLQTERMSQTMSEGGFTAVIDNLLDGTKVAAHARAAAEWVENAIDAVRSAPDFASLGVSTDEQIAELILTRLQEKKRSNQAVRSTTKQPATMT